MTGNHSGLEVVAHAQGADYAVEEHGRLCHLGLLQLISSSLEHDIGNLEAKHLVGFVEKFLGKWVVLIEVFAHSNELGSLTGEYECFHI